MVTIIQDRNACIGCGRCADACPDNWEMEGGKAVLIGGKMEGNLYIKTLNDAGCNNDAADTCLVKCITIK